MAQASAAHLGHRDPTGSHHGCQCQRSLIPHTSGTVFVHLAAMDSGQIQHLTTVCHGHGQFISLLLGHLLKVDRHHQRGYLIIRNLSTGIALDKKVDLFFRKLSAVSFFHDNVIHPHRLCSCLRQ